MSIAVEVNRLRICAGVSPGLADLSSPAMAAACGAAAEVPKNGLAESSHACDGHAVCRSDVRLLTQQSAG